MMRRCPYSDPKKPHYFKPLYRGQWACCIGFNVEAFWDEWLKENSAREENGKEER
jgi:hypothetical protein